jgi:hypothetical protein
MLTSPGMFTLLHSILRRVVNEMYIYGGGTDDATPQALQTYVSRVELGTLKDLWRTYLNNANITDELHLIGAGHIG